MRAYDLSARLDWALSYMDEVKLPTETRLALEAAAEIVVTAEKLTKTEQTKIEKGEKKHAKKQKVWVEVTSQPEKHKNSWMGRASFYWKNDPDKHKHSVNITLPGPAKLTVKGKELNVRPKDGDAYNWGEKHEAKEGKPESTGEKHVDKDEGKIEEVKLDPHGDANGDGVTDAARVGVPANSLAPPPKLPGLDGLTDEQKKVQDDWNAAIEGDPSVLAKQYMDTVLEKAKAKGGPPTFVTDDVKFLHPTYRGTQGDPETQAWRAKNNVLLHQGANAVAKQAFIKQLDELAKLPEGDPRRSILVTSGGVGCHAADTSLLMADGTTKLVQDVQEGDALMGPDSEPRKVLRLIRGTGPMFRVVPTKGDPFVVNDEHVLSVKSLRGPGTMKRTQEIVLNMMVKDLLNRGASFRRDTKLYRTEVEFPSRPVPLDPYFVGLWLGDGTHCSANVTTADEEIVDYLTTFARLFEMDSIKLTITEKPNNQACVYALALAKSGRDKTGEYRTNRVMRLLDEVGVLNNKHVPDLYIRNDRDTRLQLLAGLLDSDGSLSNGGFDFISKYEHVSKAVVFVSRSLGLAAYMTPAVKYSQTGFTATYYRVFISGETSMVPTKVRRKQAQPRQQIKDVLKTGYEIEAVGQGDFYGFSLDKDQLYVMGDFTVTHNSGKGFALKSGPENLKALTATTGAVWDAAGEQNATENPWILEECKKRGLKPTFLFVDADPKRQWAHKKLGVVQRAADPQGEGRMVDARLFADSYALGGKNFKAFHDQHKDSKDADFVFINTWDNDDKGFPIIKASEGIDDRAAKLNSDELYGFATETIQKDAPTEAIKQGATVGQKIWGPPPEKKKTEEKTTASAKKPSVLDAVNRLSAAKKSKLHELLTKNFEENMANLDEFLAKEDEEVAETVKTFEQKGLVYDKDGKLVLPKK